MAAIPKLSIPLQSMKMNTSTCERGSTESQCAYSDGRHEHHLAFFSRDLVFLNGVNSNENAGTAVEIGEANFDRGEARTSHLVVRLMSDAGLLQGMVVPMRAKALILVGMFALIFWLNWRLALVALLAAWGWPCQALDAADGLSVQASARMIFSLRRPDIPWRSTFGTNLAGSPVGGHVGNLQVPAVQEALLRL